MSDDDSDCQPPQPRVHITMMGEPPDPERLRVMLQRFLKSLAPQFAQRRSEIVEARERYEWLGPILDDYDEMERAANDVISHAIPATIASQPDTYVIVPREKIDRLQDVVDR